MQTFLVSVLALLIVTTDCPVNAIGALLPISLSEQELQELNTIAKRRSSVDLAIQFDTASPDINQDSMPALDALGQALSGLNGATFEISVFADAVGDVDKNLAILRAETIKRYLISKYQINPAVLTTTFFMGKSPRFCCVRVLNVERMPNSN
jgi:outer membrane protein OmpA-like peptidoglycan-associated protein